MNNRINVFMVAALATATGFGALQGRYLHEMTGEYVTPHFDFRGSVAERPLKALFVLDRRGARDAVEVVQRFNVEPTYFLTVSGDRIAAEDNPMKLMSLAMRPVSSPPFPLERIEEMTRLMGGDGEYTW